MPKRKYTKRSPYWNQFDQKEQSHASTQQTATLPDFDFTNISLAGDQPDPRQGHVAHFGNQQVQMGIRYPHLNDVFIPQQKTGTVISSSEIIRICQKAYFKVSIVRNTVESMVELSNRKLKVQKGSKRSRKLVEEWLKQINISSLKEEWFREFYRGGNVATVKTYAYIDDSEFNDIRSALNIKGDKVPVMYSILNPVYLAVDMSTVAETGEKQYVRALGPWEVEKLKNPRTPQDKKAFDSLPDKIKKDVRSKGAMAEIYLPINPEQLNIVFYKKQGYEDMAVPFVYSVLDDLELKEQMKAMDRQLAKVTQRMILLVTLGDEKRGVNKKNAESLRKMLASPSAGKLVVADYTTKAEFIIPEIGEMLGKQKYEQVNEDIRLGLQNILVSDEKFANQFIKIKIFVERLEEGQQKFLNEFLQPQIDEFCETMGLRDKPEVVFEKINLEDQNNFKRIIARLMELNFLTPEEGFEAMETGLFPDSETMLEDQKRFAKHKEEGLFISNTNNSAAKENGRPTGSGGQEQEGERKTGIQTEASIDDLISVDDLVQIVGECNDFETKAQALIKEKSGAKRLKKNQKEFATMLAEEITASLPKDQWHTTLEKCVNERCAPEINTKVSQAIQSLAHKHNIDYRAAAWLYHGKTK